MINIRTLFNFNERINPISIKELRQAVRSRFVTITLALYFILLMFVMILSVNADDINTNYSGGSEIFYVLFVILSGLTVVLIPLYTGIRMSMERGENRADLLFITNLTPYKIVRGKFVSAMALVLLAFGATAPYMLCAYLVRGIELPTIFFSLLWCLLGSASSVMGMLLAAVLSKNRVGKIIWILLMLVGSIGIFGTLLSFSLAYMQFGMFVSSTPREFWALTALVIYLIVISIGLKYVLTGAILSSPQSNKTMPIRIYITAIAILSYFILQYTLTSMGAGVGAGVGASNLTATVVWAISLCNIMGVAFFIAICERETQTRRVLHQIPSNRILRVLAFPFFVGSASGVTWWALMVAGIYFVVLQAVDGAGIPSYMLDNVQKVVSAVFIIGTYLWCYGFTSILIRRILVKRTRLHLATPHIFVIAVILWLTLCLTPVIFQTIFNPRGFYESSIWMYFNPLYFIVEFGRHHGNYDIAMVFSLFWATLVTLPLIRPWYLQQVFAFKPPQASPEAIEDRPDPTTPTQDQSQEEVRALPNE